MAKLSARGRYTVVEAVREKTREQLQLAHERKLEKMRAEGRGAEIEKYPASYGHQSTIWERVTVRLMSDGKVLEKLDIRFYPDEKPWPGEENGRFHSYGWKVKGKAKVPPSEFAAIYRDGTEEMKAKGKVSSWTVTYPVEVK